MNNKEIITAIKRFDLKKISSYLLHETGIFLIYPNYRSLPATKIWIGEYLFAQYKKNKITRDQLATCFMLQDSDGKNWLQYMVDQPLTMIQSAITLLKELEHDDILSIDTILELIFKPSQNVSPFILLFNDVQCVTDLIVFIQRMLHKVKADESRRARLADYLNSTRNGSTLGHLLVELNDSTSFKCYITLLIMCISLGHLSYGQVLDLILISNRNGDNVFDISIKSNDPVKIYSILLLLKDDIVTAFALLNRQPDKKLSNFHILLNNISHFLSNKKPESNPPNQNLPPQTTNKYLNSIAEIFNFLTQKIKDNEKYCTHILHTFLPPLIDNKFKEFSYKNIEFERELFRSITDNLPRFSEREFVLLRRLLVEKDSITNIFILFRKLTDETFDFVFKLLAYLLEEPYVESFLFGFLTTNQGNWKLFDIFALSKNEAANIQLLDFTFRLISQVNRLMQAKLDSDDPLLKRQGLNVQNCLGIWHEGLIFHKNKKDHPCYLQILIEKKHYQAMIKILEFSERTILSSRDLMANILRTLVEPAIIKDCHEQNRNWYQRFVSKIIEELYIDDQPITLHERACIEQVAKLSNGAANYVLSKITCEHAAFSVQQYQTAAHEVNYDLIKIEAALTELKRHGTATALTTLCNRLVDANRLNKCLTRYLHLELLTADDYLLLLSRCTFSNSNQVKFLIGKHFYSMRQLDNANKKLNEIEDLTGTTSEQLSEMAFLHFHLFNELNDYQNLYSALACVHFATKTKHEFFNFLVGTYHHFLETFPFFIDLLAWEQEENAELKTSMRSIKNAIIAHLNLNKGKPTLNLNILAKIITNKDDIKITIFVNNNHSRGNALFHPVDLKLISEFTNFLKILNSQSAPKDVLATNSR